MFRVIFGIIVSIFMISLLRMIVGAITREVTPSAKGPAAAPQQPRSQGGGGDLRKCPACGTYHATMAVAGKSKSGEVLHFCSLACREKFAAA